MSRAAMQMALDTLENLQGLCTDSDDGCVEAVTIWTPDVITALREALAQPEQEPVARLSRWGTKGESSEGYTVHFLKELPQDAALLYTAPPPAQRHPLTDEQFKKFRLWAGEAGYDCAYTYDTDRSKWLCLSPMTADLWGAWQAAHGIGAKS